MSALDEALCWGCSICTFNNPLEAGQCAMCNNPRPQVQYDNLLQIREEARRQRILQEEHDRQIAMNSNVNSIKYQTLNNETNEDEDEEEAAKKLLEADDGQDWNDNDFKDDDDEDWGDNNNGDNNNNNNDNDNNESIEMNEYEEDEYEDDDDGNDNNDDFNDDGWGDADITDPTIGDIEMKIPEKREIFTILTPHKLHEYQVNFMKEISEELYINDMDIIGILCRYYRWNRSQLMDEYLLNTDDVLKKCGIISSSPSLSKPAISGSFDCWLCIKTYSDISTSTFYPRECGHIYCNECWRNYLISQMEKGPRCILTKCIDPSCKLILRPSVFMNFLPYKKRIKFEEYILHSFVSGLNTLEWCPGKECKNAIRMIDIDNSMNIPLSISCLNDGGYEWCFNCLSTAHLPCNCELAAKWQSLHTTDSENVTWVRAFTKQCPKCKNHIEKNQGCNHMTCRCGYEFCWLCRKDWKKIGYGHQCNKPQDVIDEENEQKTAQSYLKRYMFYFSRYEAHEKSAEIAMKSIKNAKECIRSFIINDNNYYNTIKQYKYSDLQFIEDAILEIIQCKHILQWSYCFGYYLADNCPLKILFESQQGLLESFSDQLHERAEKKVDDKSQWKGLSDIKFRTELINLTKTAKKYRTNFCDALLSDHSLPFLFQKGLKK